MRPSHAESETLSCVQMDNEALQPHLLRRPYRIARAKVLFLVVQEFAVDCLLGTWFFEHFLKKYYLDFGYLCTTVPFLLPSPVSAPLKN